MRTIIISAADEGFFFWLKGLVESIRELMGQNCPALGVLDLGLSGKQREWLCDAKVNLQEPEWDFDFPGMATRDRRFRAQTARPFLAKYFPGYDVFIWMDADTWLQRPDAVGWLQLIASRNQLAIAAEMHIAYKRHYNDREIFGKYAIFKDFFGSKVAEEFGFSPSLNVGVFALHKDAPHWRVWREIMHEVLQVESSFFAEQTSLDYAVYRDQLPVGWLPAQANWLCHQALPMYCPRQGLLVEPIVPYAPLWIVHLTMATKNMDLKLPTTRGDFIDSKLNYHDFREFLQTNRN